MKKTLIIASILLYTTVLPAFSQQPPGKGKFTNFTEAGVLFGNSLEENKAPFIFHSSLNYGLYKNLSAGIGVGLEFLKETYMPVTANIMYQFRKDNAIFPFLRFRTGYQVALENTTIVNIYSYWPSVSSSYYSYYPYYPVTEKLKARGGWIAEPSLGVTVYTRAGLGFSFAAGYRYQKLKYSVKDDYIIWTEYNRLMLTLGITF